VEAILPATLPAGLPVPVDFDEWTREIGVELDPGDSERLGRYLALLEAGNASMNLTSVVEPEQMWRRHVLDSLTLVGPLAELPDGSRVMDVGSGGGVPGVPLAICMPGIEFVLLEATEKKAAFLLRVVELLGLKNVRVVHDRAERAGQDRGKVSGEGRVGGHREAYDAVIARAVGRITILAELTVPLCRVGGRVLLIKGAKAEEEVGEAKEALHQLKAVYAGTMETPTGRIVALEKSSATPRTFPRPDGEPARRPIT
jgi:16S rRNA (guanine527-N7)-methyltransferase